MHAAEVGLVGIFPGKAVISIDGGAPRIVAVGQTLNGVKLVSISGDTAIIEVGGKQERIVLGAQPLNAGGGDDAQGQQSITLIADSRGHFVTTGSLNGALTTFVVDTGASSIAMGPGQARQAGIDYTKGEAAMVGTANGVAKAWRVRIDRVTVNGLTLRDVEGMVLPQDMPIVLLGMTFLNRMNMTREGNTMVLKRRY
ncbi:retropepsin-like aspartic protease family protein [Viridibacterium curvum]|uniref:TIGR02281 family clan AA aspartic protease n=1 Tax=Viridibacterium curvum TaxID=1101404 RepID=A0ABP9QXD8_9RHOO